MGESNTHVLTPSILAQTYADFAFYSVHHGIRSECGNASREGEGSRENHNARPVMRNMDPYNGVKGGRAVQIRPRNVHTDYIQLVKTPTKAEIKTSSANSQRAQLKKEKENYMSPCVPMMACNMQQEHITLNVEKAVQRKIRKSILRPIARRSETVGNM
jgi:hypothetical protein